jgi:transposase
MEEEREITTERIDDFVVLLTLMKQMDLPAILDRQIKRHHLQQGISWGWTACIWLAHIISQGDHRKLTVRDWVRQAHNTLEEVTGLSIRETDFTDDRLTIVLRYLSEESRWQSIEQDLGKHLIKIYDLQKEPLRVDATTVSGYREGGEKSLWQFGHSKDDPALKQIKVMMATLDPLGLPIATDVVSGEKADDPLYVPILERALACLEHKGLLVVGDCKMSALSTRAYLQAQGQYYLTPLAQVGEVATLLPEWIKEGRARGENLTQVLSQQGQEKPPIIAQGYERSRTCVSGELNWEERILVIRSPAYADREGHLLSKRLAAAVAALLALTPAVGPGKRQIKEEEKLVSAAEAIVSKYRVQGLLTYRYERQVEQKSKLIGRGRSGTHRQSQVIEQVRYQMTAVERNEEAIAEQMGALGWRAYATTAPRMRLSLEEAVYEYREEYHVERGFGRFKGAPLSIAPMFVQRDDQVAGLTHLLSLAVRVLTLMEFVVRRSLKAREQKIVGLSKDSPRKATATPTAERLLQAFTPINLTEIHYPDRIVRHVTPLNPVQKHILALLGFAPDLYSSLARTSPPILSTSFALRE